MLILIGIILIISGLYVRFLAIKTNKSFSYIIKRPDELCTVGVYNFVRHPGYLGNILTYFGVALLFLPLAAAILFSFVLWVHLDHRADLEEQLLRKEFPQYEQYANTVGKFIPNLRRLYVSRK